MEQKSKRRVVTGFGAVLILLLFMALFFREYFITVQVSGNSMHKTLEHGRRLLACSAYWLVGDIRKNDIIVAKGDKPNEFIIKRVYRLAGESVDWLNVPRNWKFEKGEYIVPDGTIYVLGDNRSESEDSRMFGPIPLKKVVGKVVLLQ